MSAYLSVSRRPGVFRSVAERELERHHRSSRQFWPVNEIVMRSLLLAGKDSAQIASQYGVSVDQVVGLRRDYDL